MYINVVEIFAIEMDISMYIVNVSKLYVSPL